MSNAHAMPSAIAHHSPATSAPTWGVKYKPSAVPITHCPPLRRGAQLAVGAPVNEATAVTNRGPSIQGMGVCNQAHSTAAAAASANAMAEHRAAGIAAGADGHDHALLGLFAGRVGDDDAAGGLEFRFFALDDQAIVQGTEGHDGELPVWV